MIQKKSKKKIALIAVLITLVLLIGGGWAFSARVYNENINKRLESVEPLMLHIEDFKGLECTKYKFPSDKGQMLSGSFYHFGRDQRGIIIIAHGYGAGHNSYMDCANYFAKHGYDVFAFDITGNDESEGEGVGGFPQAVVDLDYAISFVEKSGNFPELPIGLFGHSWGGYSVCSVLTYHPEVKAVISCCGSNRSSDFFEAAGKYMAGDGIYAMMPFVKLHEWTKYGKYASNTAMDGFEVSNAAVFITHSEDDKVVPMQYGYDLYHKKYQDNPRFTFLLFKDKGHNDFLYDQNNTYKETFLASLDKWVKGLDYDQNTEKNKAHFSESRAEYIHTHLDRAQWSNRLDEDLFDQFLNFYDLNMKKE